MNLRTLLDLKINRTDRLGSNSAKKPGPIVTKFHDYSDKEKNSVRSFDEEIKIK